jgi:RHS repeat-associated protein
MFEAARMGDTIAHSSALAGFIAGAVAGLALFAVATFCIVSGGLGAIVLGALLTGLAPTLPSLGAAIGSLFKTPSGFILFGSPNVFINNKSAARVSSPVQCTRHPPQHLIATGSSTVFINNQPAARVDDKTTCDATISTGSNNVFTHGPTVQCLPIESEIPEEYRRFVDKLFTVLEIATMFLGLAALGKILVKCLTKNALKQFTKQNLKCAAKFGAGVLAGMGADAAGHAMGDSLTRLAGGQTKNPVEVTSGRKILHPEIDLATQGALPIVISRFYSSHIQTTGALGQGWLLPWETQLIVHPKHLDYTDAQGRRFTLPHIPKGQQFKAPGEPFSLWHLHDGRWVIRSLDDTSFLYGPIDPDQPNTLGLIHIEQDRGLCIQLSYSKGRVSAMTDALGQRVELQYSEIQTPSGSETRLTQALWAEGGPPLRVTYHYDAQARLISVGDAHQTTRQFTWGNEGPALNLMTSHSNALGYTHHYRWETVAGLPKVVEYHSNLGERSLIEYHDHSARLTNEQGHWIQWLWNEQGHVTECIDFDGARYRFDYDADGQLTHIHLPSTLDPATQTEQPNTWALVYDELGRVVQETSPAGRITRQAFCPDSLRLQTYTDALGATWRYEHEPTTGVLIRSTDPLGQQTVFTWASPFGPSEVTDAMGNTTSYTWNTLGQLTEQTDCSGHASRYSYNHCRQLNAQVDALGQTTHLLYDDQGRLVRITHPDGSTEHYQHNPLGLVTEYRDASGHIHQWQYREDGLIQRAIRPSEHPDKPEHTAYEFNPQGHVLAIAHGAARYRFELDPLGRLVCEHRPDHTALRHRFNAQGWVSETQRLGDDGQIRATFFEYDPDGLLIQERHRHCTTRFSHDANGQVLRIEQSPSPEGLALGVLADHITFQYDALGRLIEEHSLAQGATVREYDRLGNPTAQSLPTGQRLQWLRYGSGHVHQVRLNDQVVCDFERDAMHREVLRSQGRVSVRSQYDAMHRLTEQQAWAPRPTQPLAPTTQAASQEPTSLFHGRYQWTPRGTLLSEQHQFDQQPVSTQYFRHDPAGRLTRQTDQFGHARYFAWDAADNLHTASSFDHAQQRPVEGSLLAGNRLLRMLLSKVQERLRFEFDPWGRVVARHREDWHGHALVESLYFTWDDHDRLLCLERHQPSPSGPLVRRTCFAYDALGRRMAKWDASAPQGESMPTIPSLEAMPKGCTRFVWDGMRMVAELDPYNSYTTVYHPDRPYSPLARVHQAHTEGVLHPALRLRWYLNDPVGRPRCLMDAQGSSTWQSDYLPWGKTLNEQCHLGQNQYLRFPGQYEDSETGLYYNTFRYYDPEAGRYLCPDPIGLAGGLNLYAYVFDPHSQIDPWGLCTQTLVFKHKQKPGKETNIRELKRQIRRQIIRYNKIIKQEGIDGLKRRVNGYNGDVERAGRAHVRTLGRAGENKVWLHEPDMRTGGAPTDVFGIGGARENSIIGGQADRIANDILAMPANTTRISSRLILE